LNRRRARRSIVVIAVALVALACARDRDTAAADPASYTRETLVPGIPFHGIHGITAGPDGMLYVGSVVGQATYRVDPSTGAIDTAIPAPEGCADDLEFGPDGRLYWTQLFGRSVVGSAVLGADGAPQPGAPIQVLAADRTGINSIAWKQDGRLFATEVFDGDALYEIDPRGAKEARLVLSGIGGLNGFDFGPDGKLYGPLWFRKEVARVDVDSGALTVVATGFETPAAANFDSQGRLHVLDTARGEVVQVDTATGERTVVATLVPGLDNLAFDAQDRLFVTNMANNGIYEVDTEGGTSRTVVEGRVAVPAGLDLVEEADGREVLHVADTFAYRTVDLASGQIATVKRVYEEGLINPLNLAVGETRVLITFFFRGEAQLLERASGRVLETLELAAPGAVLALPGDRFLVTDLQAGALVEMPVQGEERRTVAQGLGLPAGLDSAGADRVYVSDAASGRLLEVELASGAVEEIALGLAQPEGIATTPAGNVVVAEVGARALSRIDPETGERTVIAQDLPIGLPVPAGLPPTYIPTGVAVSKNGTIYLSSDVDSAIYRFTPGAAAP
jgi:sugar lactone lactonase YvrE